MRLALVLAAVFAPSVALAAPPAKPTAKTPKVQPQSAAPAKPKPARTARAAKKPCNKAPVEVVAGGESATFSLATCNGDAAPLGVVELSILARPGGVRKPAGPIEQSKRGAPEIAPGIRRIDARLVERLELAVDHFRKTGETPRVVVVSGYRPKTPKSFHATGRALDVRIDGVTNEALVAFCKTLPDTGCGYYPNSLFVHIDVRDPGTGHVAWIDASRPGEPPKYVTTWPPKGESPAAPAAAADPEETDVTSPPSTASPREP